VQQINQKLTIISMKNKSKLIAGLSFTKISGSVPAYESEQTDYSIWQQASHSTHGYTLWMVSANQDASAEFWGTFNECVKYLDSKLSADAPSFNVNDSVSFTDDYTHEFDVFTIQSIQENGTIKLQEIIGTFFPKQFTLVHNFINHKS
jgi:hypothetical protein